MLYLYLSSVATCQTVAVNDNGTMCPFLSYCVGHNVQYGSTPALRCEQANSALLPSGNLFGATVHTL